MKKILLVEAKLLAREWLAVALGLALPVGLLLILPASGLSLEDNLRRLIRLVRTPLVDR